ncbi:transposase, partial [Ligilactobacillus salitolerans]|uniref:transposase n=1 Tax=Ligilactobacillus salitolerans TaxID=1808352 RepID=UPI00157FA025
EINPDTQRVYGVSFGCRYLQVSRAAYYKWLERKPTKHDLENQKITQFMLQLEEENNYIFGVKRLVTYINQETIYHVGPNRVRNLMHKAQIESSIRVAKHDRKAKKKEVILANKLLTA